MRRTRLLIHLGRVDQGVVEQNHFTRLKGNVDGRRFVEVVSASTVSACFLGAPLWLPGIPRS